MLVIALVLILERGVREQVWGSVPPAFHITITNTQHYTCASVLSTAFDAFYKMLNYVLVTVCKTNSNTWCTFCCQ